ncbi:MAG: hypothetical protein AAB719_00915 [Patescibacteria group bacterium]
MTLALILMVGFFVLSLIARTITRKDFCALCASVTLTWLTLLILRFTGAEVDSLVLAILLGGSAVGLMYYFFSGKSDMVQIFKFPFVISLFWAISLVLLVNGEWLRDLGIIILVWIVFFTVYLFYKNDRLKEIGRKLIECCKNW